MIRTLLACALVALPGCTALPVGGGDLLTRHDRAVAAERDGRVAEAEAEYRALVRALPERADPAFRLGNLLARTGRLDEAVEMYEEALRRDPEHVRAWHNLGTTHLQLARLALIEGASRAQPSDPVREGLLEQLEQLGLGEEEVGGER